MAFLQTHDSGLRVLKQLMACTNPLPHDLTTQQVSSCPWRSHSLTGPVVDAFHLSFCTFDKGWFAYISLRKSGSPPQVHCPHLVVWLIQETIRSLLGAGCWECCHGTGPALVELAVREALSGCQCNPVEASAGGWGTHNWVLGALRTLPTGTCSEAPGVVCSCLPFLLYSSIPFEH